MHHRAEDGLKREEREILRKAIGCVKSLGACSRVALPTRRHDVVCLRATVNQSSENVRVRKVTEGAVVYRT